MPISRTVAPTTETITRLTTLIFSMFQILENHFIYEGEPIDCSLPERRPHNHNIVPCSCERIGDAAD